VEQLLVADSLLEPVPPADVLQSHDRERDQRGEDDEELQHLVVDRRREPAESDVGEHDEGGDDDPQQDRPAEEDLQHQREREQVHAGDQHGRDGEAQRVEEMGRLAEAHAQVLRHAADLGAVVERHHHEPEEDHRRDRADPVVVHRVGAELRAVRRHAEDLERAEVRRDEREARDPRRQRAAGQEVVEAGLDVAPGGEADAQHGDEVDRQDRVVDRVGIQLDVHLLAPVRRLRGCPARLRARRCMAGRAMARPRRGRARP
jgi:hypothetical protein